MSKDWEEISMQSLSEEFIRENSDKVDWFWISRYQKLSEEFIRENSDKVDWYCIYNTNLLYLNYL